MNGGERYERFWQELRHHIEWTQGFALLFYFCDDIQLAYFLRQRLQQFLIGNTSRLQTVDCYGGEAWLENTLDRLLSRSEKWRLLHAPLWLDLTRDQTEQALADYRKLLLRLNERRDSLRKYYVDPVIILLPTSFQQECRLAAPDLWSIRSFSEIIHPPSPTRLSNNDPKGNRLERGRA